MRRAARVDDNQAAIVRELRQLGFSVCVLARVGEGCPDLLIGRGRRTGLVEVKAPPGPKGGGGGELTPHQELWHSTWRGSPVIVATSSREVWDEWTRPPAKSEAEP
jgi:hypothetical protein